MQSTVVRHQDGLAVEVNDGDAVGLGQAEVVEPADAGPLVSQHLALAGEGIGVDVVLPGESGFHGESMAGA